MKGHIIEEAIIKENKCTTTTNAKSVDKEPSIFELNTKSGIYPVVTISGSLSHLDKIEELTKILSTYFVVLAPCHVDTRLFRQLNPDDDTSRILTEIHFQKIDMCDALIVVNPQDYIGNGTLLEIMYANTIGIPIYFMYEPESFVIKSIFDRLDIDYKRTPISFLIPS